MFLSYLLFLPNFLQIFLQHHSLSLLKVTLGTGPLSGSHCLWGTSREVSPLWHESLSCVSVSSINEAACVQGPIPGLQYFFYSAVYFSYFLQLFTRKWTYWTKDIKYRHICVFISQINNISLDKLISICRWLSSWEVCWLFCVGLGWGQSGQAGSLFSVYLPGYGCEEVILGSDAQSHLCCSLQMHFPVIPPLGWFSRPGSKLMLSAVPSLSPSLMTISYWGSDCWMGVSFGS